MRAAYAAHAADITRTRHRGNANSNAAFESCHGTNDIKRNMIWHKLRLHPFGLTAKELAAHFGVPLHTLSGRITELKQVGRAIATGERRDGSGIVVALNPDKDLLAGVQGLSLVERQKYRDTVFVVGEGSLNNDATGAANGVEKEVSGCDAFSNSGDMNVPVVGVALPLHGIAYGFTLEADGDDCLHIASLALQTSVNRAQSEGSDAIG